MSHRTVTALLTAAALASPALLVSAHAAPVEQHRIAATEFHIGLGAGRTLDVQLRLTTGASGASLAVATMRCDASGCYDSADYAGPVSGAVISGSEIKATLRTILGGRSLALTWTPGDDNARSLGGLRGSGNGGEDDMSIYSGQPALVAASIGGVSCHLTGVVGDEVYVSDTSGRAAGVSPLTAFRLPARAPATC